MVYRRLARAVAADISDYAESGFTVIGIVGVGASPSCGVATTLDLRRSFDVMANTAPEGLDRRAVNREVVLAARRVGTGIFIATLERQLRRRGLDVPLFEHDLALEMRGAHQRVLDVPVRATRGR